jgi:hypothetical protein
MAETVARLLVERGIVVIKKSPETVAAALGEDSNASLAALITALPREGLHHDGSTMSGLI